MLTFQTDSDAAFGIGDDHDSVDLSLREDPSLEVVVRHADDHVFPDQRRRPPGIEWRARYRLSRDSMPSHRGGSPHPLPGVADASSRILNNSDHST